MYTDYRVRGLYTDEATQDIIATCYDVLYGEEFERFLGQPDTYFGRENASSLLQDPSYEISDELRAEIESTFNVAEFDAENDYYGGYQFYDFGDAEFDEEEAEEFAVPTENIRRESFNLREALNRIDLDTGNRYDLLNLYEACNLKEAEKRALANIVYDQNDPEVIYDTLNDRFVTGKEVDMPERVKDGVIHEDKTALNEGNYRGAKGITFIGHGSWSDPELEYKGYLFNYWDIEDALWSEFLEETGHSDSQSDDPEVEKEFDTFVKERGADYLDDCIYGKAFTGLAIEGDIVEFPNGEYYYVGYKDGKISLDTTYNAGRAPEYSIDFDVEYSIDGNLQRLYDHAIEKTPWLNGEDDLDESKAVNEATGGQKRARFSLDIWVPGSGGDDERERPLIASDSIEEIIETAYNTDLDSDEAFYLTDWKGIYYDLDQCYDAEELEDAIYNEWRFSGIGDMQKTLGKILLPQRESVEDYGCDICAKRHPQKDINWFNGASLGVCPTCYDKLSDEEREHMHNTGTLMVEEDTSTDDTESTNLTFEEILKKYVPNHNPSDVLGGELIRAVQIICINPIPGEMLYDDEPDRGLWSCYKFLKTTAKKLGADNIVDTLEDLVWPRWTPYRDSLRKLKAELVDLINKNPDLLETQSSQDCLYFRESLSEMKESANRTADAYYKYPDGLKVDVFVTEDEEGNFYWEDDMGSSDEHFHSREEALKHCEEFIKSEVPDATFEIVNKSKRD